MVADGVSYLVEITDGCRYLRTDENGMKEFDRKALWGAAALLVLGSGVVLRELLLDEVAWIEGSMRTVRVMENRSVLPRSDKVEIKLTIYATYMTSDAKVYLVDESDEFIRILRARTKVDVRQRKSGMEGWQVSIAGLEISDDSAVAGLAALGGNTGMELFGVRLRKVGRTWEIVHWHLDAVA